VSIKSVITNTGWLGFIQALNYIVPLVTLPVVIRALGPSVYGLFAALNAYATYIGVFTNFGLRVSGPRAIINASGKNAVVSQFVSAGIGAQVVVGLAAVAVLYAIMIAVYGGEEFGASTYELVGALVMLNAFALALAPQWIFLGLERLRDFSIVQVVCRSGAALAILLTIRKQDDLLLYVSLNCASSLLVVLLSLFVLRSYGISWELPSKNDVVKIVVQSKYLFFSSLSISFYTSTMTLIVAGILGVNAAGQFAVADRVRTAISGLIGPMTQGIYPFVCRLSNEDAENAEGLRRLFFRGILGFAAILSLIVYFCAPLIVKIIGGSAFAAAIPILQVLAFVPLVTAISNTMGMQTMLPMHMDREYTFAATSAAVLGPLLVSVLAWNYGLTSAASGMLVTEIYVCVAFGWFLRRRRINLLSLYLSVRRTTAAD
jgi:PST family polysaccharide transporter